MDIPRRPVERMVADKVTDEMLLTPVSDLTDGEISILEAALRGPFSDEIVARIDVLKGRDQ